MAKLVIEKLIDDLDGGDADETVMFALDGKAYELDLNSKNARAIRKAFAPYIQKARASGGRARSRISPPGKPAASGRGRTAKDQSAKTLFSQLDVEEKERFRKWATMPNTRRIADTRVAEWIEAGRP